ncbi:MAG: class II glutamine amidotransferase, partial [Candidatus Promineifilaceae bacterium]
MCGIVGYIGPRQAQDVILAGLKRLEYRGYDSAGLAVIEANGRVAVRRDAGKLANLEALVAANPLRGHIGIGHTRWATHGAPVRHNAHPHMGMAGRVVLVHNGIVENYLELRDELAAEGVAFKSETDSEVIVQLVERLLATGLDMAEAVRQAMLALKGSNAVVVMATDQPDQLVAARLGNAGGITLGVGAGEMFIASDLPAILEYTREMLFLENRQMATVMAENYVVQDLAGRPVSLEAHAIPYDPVSVVKGEFKHFMQKEIFEQPQAMIDTLRGRVDLERGQVSIPELNLTPELAGRIERMYTVACGTSYYAGLIGKYQLEA